MAAGLQLRLSARTGIRPERAECLLAVAIGIVLVHLMDVAGWQLGSIATILLALALCPTKPSLRASRTDRRGR
jgi:hypothetical protein